MSDEPSLSNTSDDETALRAVTMHRPRWGDPTTPADLPAAAAALAGADAVADTGVDPDAVVLAEPVVPEAVRTAL
ncbi:MAG: hypothetical protein KAH46_08170, partial [Mycobacterium sp.]|nr:hypothetical protein [Mycobacterium sp.]